MSETTRKQWVIVKQRISKGDLIFETDVEIWDEEEKAKNALEFFRRDVSPCWPDWDDYAISVREIPEKP